MAKKSAWIEAIRNDWKDLSFAFAALIVAILCLTATVVRLIAGDNGWAVGLCILSVVASCFGLSLASRKLRDL